MFLTLKIFDPNCRLHGRAVYFPAFRSANSILPGVPYFPFHLLVSPHDISIFIQHIRGTLLHNEARVMMGNIQLRLSLQQGL